MVLVFLKSTGMVVENPITPILFLHFGRRRKLSSVRYVTHLLSMCSSIPPAIYFGTTFVCVHHKPIPFFFCSRCPIRSPCTCVSLSYLIGPETKKLKRKCHVLFYIFNRGLDSIGCLYTWFRHCFFGGKTIVGGKVVTGGRSDAVAARAFCSMS